MRVAMLVVGSLLLTDPAGAQTTIYRCAGEGGTVYSDRPCGQNAAPHQIDNSRVTVYTPAPAVKRPVTTASAKPTGSRPAKKPRPPDPAKHRLACARLDQSLRDVRTRMRTGYGAQEGERLKARQRLLDQRLRLEKCS
jgi:hypothetical protein